MADWTKYLIDLLPVTGRKIKENGIDYNVADDMELRRQSDVSMSSRDGNIFRGFWQGEILPETIVDFAISVPNTIVHYGMVREVGATASSIFETLFIVDSFTTSSPPIFGKNFDRRKGMSADSVSSIQIADTITNAIQHSPESEIFVPTAGPTRAPSAQTRAGAHPAFNGGEAPMVRLENKSATVTAIATIQFFWQELSNT